jgi:hypothetical protein
MFHRRGVHVRVRVQKHDADLIFERSSGIAVQKSALPIGPAVLQTPFSFFERKSAAFRGATRSGLSSK